MTYRNKKILEAANGAPCMRCGTQDGTVVAAHSNQQRDGKGMGHKSADYRVAYLCHRCHDQVDGRTGMASGAVRNEMWEEAHRKTVGFWFENGMVKT